MGKGVTFSLFLVYLLTFGIVIVMPIAVYAQSNVETFAFISVEPTPAQYTQDTVYVSIRIEPAPPTPEDKFQRVAVTVTRPDGITATNYYDSKADGTLQFSTYSNPDMVGNWLFKVSFLGQAFSNNTIYYLPSENHTTFTRLSLSSSSTSPTPAPWSTVGSWATKALMPTPRGGLGVAVVDGKIYAIGGSTARGGGGTQNGPLSIQGVYVGTVEEYNPATNTWATKKSMLTPRSSFAIAVYQNKIYCIGGSTSTNTTGVNEVYDPTTNTWEIKTSMPTPRNTLQANVVDNKMYLIGGYVPDTSPFGYALSALNEVYDPATDVWTTKAPIPNTVSSYASAVVDNKIYVIGGLSSNPQSNLNQIYNPKTDKWSLGTFSPSGNRYGAAVATTGEMAPKRIYIISEVSTSNQIYDPKTDTWTFGANLPTHRENFAATIVNDTIYVIGGQTFTFPSIYSNPYGPSITPYSTNEQYTPADYGTPDPTYQTPTPPLSPSSSSSPALNPTSTPALSPSRSPSSSAAPTTSPQITSSPEPNSTNFASEVTYFIVVSIVVIALIAIGVVRFRKR